METPAFAREMRCEIIKMLTASKSGHPGGSLSCTDILAVLYNEVLRIDPKNPREAGRDRFVLTKAHCAPALYAALALKGFFPMEDLADLRKLGSPLQGHPEMHLVPGVEVSGGSLGQSLSTACGMALAGKLDGKDYRVYTVSGDGECEEGQIWEAAMFAAAHGLDNLISFIDHNHLQLDGTTAEILNPDPLAEKFRAFGWYVIEINGHDYDELRGALLKAKTVQGKPTMIVAETVKGKGVSFMENQVKWHGAAPNAEQAAQALAELMA